MICHLCDAEAQGLPYTDVSSAPQWLSTLGASLPWESTPPLNEAPFSVSSPAFLYKLDPFHVLKFGIFRDACASTVIRLCFLEYFDCEGELQNVPERLSRAFSFYKLWCLAEKKNPSLKGFTRMNMHYDNNHSFAWFNCKGSEVTLLMQWLDFQLLHFLENVKQESHRPELRAMHQMIRGDVLDYASSVEDEKPKFQMGIHTGPVIAGVVGQKLPRFRLFGDTVNTAARMMQKGLPDEVQFGDETRRLLPEHIRYRSRGPIQMKGKGAMNVYLLIHDRRRNHRLTFSGARHRMSRFSSTVQIAQVMRRHPRQKTSFINMGFAATCLELVRPRNGGAASPRIARIPLLLSDSGEGGTAVGTADLEAPAETSNLSEVSTESSDLDDPLALADLLLDPQINVRLVRGTFLRKLHQEQRPAVRRQEIEQEADALVTQDELIRWRTDADFRQKVRIIGVSHVWETMEHPDPAGHQLAILAEWSWYFFDYMSIYQFYRGSAESYQQQCFDRAMASMHYFYAHEYTHTYFITKLSPARALDTTTKIEVFYAPDGDGEAGQMQEVPIKDLKRNDTPYFERGWCEAEMQWSCMRGQASQTIALDFYEHSRALSLYCRAPMPPDVFQRQVERNELRFTHADNSKDVMKLQRRVFLEKAAMLEVLSRTDLSASQIVVLGLALPFYSRLQVLTIVGSQIEAAGAEELAKALNMKELNLSHCSISCAAMSALAGGLQASQKLTRLVCTSCALRSEHIEALPRALTSQSQIQILDLSGNQIDCDGATALARALLEGSKLRKLSLRRNQIADRGAGAFADVLRRAAVESLSDLDLDGNEIEAPGWTLLDQALEEVELLAEAWFDKFRLRSAGQKIFAMVKTGTSMGFDEPDDVEMFEDALMDAEQKQQQRWIDWLDCKCGDEQAKHFREWYYRNHLFKKLVKRLDKQLIFIFVLSFVETIYLADSLHRTTEASNTLVLVAELDQWSGELKSVLGGFAYLNAAPALKLLYFAFVDLQVALGRVRKEQEKRDEAAASSPATSRQARSSPPSTSSPRRASRETQEEPHGEDDADEGETVAPPEDDRDEHLADEDRGNASPSWRRSRRKNRDADTDSDDSTRALADIALWERYDETLPDVLPSELLGWLLLRRAGLSHQASLAVQSAASGSLRLDDIEKALRAMEDEILGQELRPRGLGGKGHGRHRTYWVEEGGEWSMWLGENGDLDELFDSGEIHYVGKKLPPQVHPEPYVAPDYDEEWTYYGSGWDSYPDEWSGWDYESSWWYDDLSPDQQQELEEAYAAVDQKARTFVEARQAVKARNLSRGFYPFAPSTKGGAFKGKKGKGKGKRKGKGYGSSASSSSPPVLAASGSPSLTEDGSGFLGAAVGDPAYTGCFICGSKVYAIQEDGTEEEIFSQDPSEDLSGYAVLDSGATETVASLPALEALMRVRQGSSDFQAAERFQVLDQPPKKFKFGNGEFAVSSSFLLLPQQIGDHRVDLGVYTLDVVGVPVLIGIKTMMMRLHAVVDFAHCRAVFVRSMQDWLFP
ncbi:Guanylate cyclase soluble subunit beta-2 [Symbiodinium microadriaticum]|uniref:Guanylate cyclase soluble subunit beta-2 n=1 Tax=Symbiodinium microadriaticum TaxID=2951 RepID=A0A1Q9E9P8_SYMMI|nr:Guanylate cyclase soluble subunit beta-2 [Symbiodinium microadriaticum]